MPTRSGHADGTVRFWHVEEGWGVLDSPSTPDGCYASFAAIQMDGFRELARGERVSFEFLEFASDGYAYQATAVHRPNHTIDRARPDRDSSAYSSDLAIDSNEPR